MKHKPNHIIHFAIGAKRVNKCIDSCRQPMTTEGTFYSEIFKPQQITTYRHIYIELPTDMVLYGNIRILR